VEALDDAVGPWAFDLGAGVIEVLHRRIIDAADAPTLARFVRMVVSYRADLVATDDNQDYNYKGETSGTHRLPTYAANTCAERFTPIRLSLFGRFLKCGIIGTYHNVSAKYLPLWLNGFQFRFNNRKNEEIFSLATGRC
jgi:ISXO2-like transposase domain